MTSTFNVVPAKPRRAVTVLAVAVAAGGQAALGWALARATRHAEQDEHD